MHVYPQLSGRIWCSRHTYQSQPFCTNVHADLWACERHRAQVFTPNYNEYLEILLTPPLSYDILLEFYINYTPDNHLLTCSSIHWYLKKVEDLCQRQLIANYNYAVTIILYDKTFKGETFCRFCLTASFPTQLQLAMFCSINAYNYIATLSFNTKGYNDCLHANVTILSLKLTPTNLEHQPCK